MSIGTSVPSLVFQYQPVPFLDLVLCVSDNESGRISIPCCLANNPKATGLGPVMVTGSFRVKRFIKVLAAFQKKTAPITTPVIIFRTRRKSNSLKELVLPIGIEP